MSGGHEPGGARRRPGPTPRFSQEQLIDAAVAIVDEHGFDNLSLRAVARQLGVTPMALYTYVRSSDDLVAMVVERLVEQKASGLEFPEAWQDALRVFARNLGELLLEHPAMLRAYAEGAVRGGEAVRVADAVLGRLAAGGLAPDDAIRAYYGVHMVVLGLAVVHDLRGRSRLVIDADTHPAAATHMNALDGLRLDPLTELVDVVIAGIEARQATRPNASTRSTTSNTSNKRKHS